jgi:FtsH-binding integral membrane protein
MASETSVYSPPQVPAAQASVERRADFIVRTYNTLFVAILGFAGLEVLYFKMGWAEPIAILFQSNWLLALGGFMLVGWFGSKVAMTSKSSTAAYGALAAFVTMESFIFVPLLFIANQVAPGAIKSAAIITAIGFLGLTAIAWQTRKDFSFLGGILKWAGVVALVLIVASMLFGFQLGTFFSVGMVALAGAAILYETSNVLRHYPENRHAAAALALFSSVAPMFYYILMLFVSNRD